MRASFVAASTSLSSLLIPYHRKMSCCLPLERLQWSVQIGSTSIFFSSVRILLLSLLVGSGPDHMIRASRHYERAGQILTRKAVATAKEFIKGVPCAAEEANKRVTVYAPARVDLAGGWTDTPPQAYEWGGVVTTLSLTLNGEVRSISSGTKVIQFCLFHSTPSKLLQRESLSKLELPPVLPLSHPCSCPLRLKLELVVLGGDGVVLDQLELTELSHLADYYQPHAPGALLKAAFICAEIVAYPSTKSLSQQLKDNFGCGFKLQSMSNVPQGSGGCDFIFSFPSLTVCTLRSRYQQYLGRSYSGSSVEGGRPGALQGVSRPCCM